jgi:hypothetical protein
MSMDDTIDSTKDAAATECKAAVKLANVIKDRPNRLKNIGTPPTPENMTRAQKFAQSQKEYKQAYNQKSKERAKEAKQTYLARPDVQEKMRLQKEKFADYRKQKSATMKSAKKSEKTALGDAEKSTRRQRQAERDAELCDMLGSASNVKPKLQVSRESNTPKSESNQFESGANHDTQQSTRRTPKFTVIHCDRK